ncbi:asparagine synthetase B family protein [Sphingomonas sp. Leaf4]|uniref:asparagine synthetase B family protein n=1 Tax=Sphingomonas sp. Leaf4 TaxID=2876553 RepID=UPI001E428BB2|nr:asparagine synthase-related protein [Sphingomonas sp. Leaf4]
MSAIAGIVRFDGTAIDPRAIERMLAAMAPRGPDGAHGIVLDSVGIGHALMRVNVEDWHEAQPIADDGLLLAADLRLDNRDALATELGIDAAGMADSAILFAAYRRWGADCVDRLLGDFAFALIDPAARTLLLARDPLGQRGVYWHRGDDFLAFASEPKGLWAVDGVPRRLSEAAMGKRLLSPVDPGPETTLFEGIESLPGGATLQLAAGGQVVVERYWVPHAAAGHVGHDDAYYVETYRRIMAEAVECRVRRTLRPPALLFSGGFDSGSIAAIAGPIVAAQGRRIVAVCSALAEGDTRPVRSARAAASAFADRDGIDLRWFVRRDETVLDNIETLFAGADDCAGISHVRPHLFAMAASSGARLVMDGHGGDYTVNPRDAWALGRVLRRGELRRFVREFRLRMRTTGQGVVRTVRNDVLGALLPLRLIAWQQAARRRFLPAWRLRAITPALARELMTTGGVDAGRLRQPMPVHARWKALRRHRLHRITCAAPAMTNLAGRYGMDLTRPFHDRRVVEFALAIPARLIFRDGRDRYLARTALADLLPARLLASGPGNDAEEPDFFRMAATVVPDALRSLRADDRAGRLARIIDFDRIADEVANINEARMSDHRALYRATFGIALARFILWFERHNDGAASAGQDQEP